MMPHYPAQLHPLLISNIVNTVLQNFDDEKFLRELRRVCRCWNDEASSLLRHVQTVRFTSEQSLQSYLSIYQHNEEIFNTFPHTSYNFYSLCLTNVKTGMDQFESKNLLCPWASDFFNRFGDHITSIFLPIRTGSLEPCLLDSIFQKIPNIRYLHLDLQYFHEPFDCNFIFSKEAIRNLQVVQTLFVQIEGLEISEENVMNFLSLLLANMSNLRKLTCPGDIRRISKVGLVLRDVVLDLEPSISDTLVRLGEWEFKTRLLEEEALKLLCTNFPMKVLHLDLWNPEDDLACISSELLGALLRKWNRSLEKLSVDFPWRKEVSFHFHFPLIMENLTFLYLGGLEGSLLEVLNKLPKLKRLELSQLELFSILPKPNGEEYPNVKQLRLDFCTGQSGGIMSRFSRIFPNLRNLNINHTTNDAARVIFQKMNHLTRLRMQGHELTDAGICGFSESTLKEHDFFRMTPTQGQSFRKYPFIADLTELQYLKLDAYGLTEITIRHGLVHSTSLHIVKMDCTGGGSDVATTSRTFRLAEYGKHLVEERKQGVIEMKEDPPWEDEAREFFSSHDKYSNDLCS